MKWSAQPIASARLDQRLDDWTYFPCLPGTSPPDSRYCVGLMVGCVCGWAQSRRGWCQSRLIVVVVVVVVAVVGGDAKAEVVGGLGILEIRPSPLASNGAKPEKVKPPKLPKSARTMLGKLGAEVSVCTW